MSGKATRDAAPGALTPDTTRPESPVGAPTGATGFAPDDFAGFLNDVAAVVAQNVAPWKQQLAEASNKWGALGYAVAVLERALARDKAPNIDGLLATYTAAVEYLRQLEAYAGAIDPALVGSAAFRDPERVALAEAELARHLPPGPAAEITRESVEVTASNSAAVAAADRAVAAPGAEHNPLYLHGPDGSGRTRLLAAAANAMRGWRSGRVAYVTAAQFADELAAAMRDNTVERWRARYLPLDVLAVDDVQALAGNARAEQELALVCATLREGGRQVLLAGSAPGGSQGLPEALRAHVERGHAVALEAPARTPAPTPLGTVGAAGADAARSAAFFFDPEKVVWDWPDVTARVIEEIR